MSDCLRTQQRKYAAQSLNIFDAIEMRQGLPNPASFAGPAEQCERGSETRLRSGFGMDNAVNG